MKELQALIGQDTYKDNRQFWEGEMSNAIRELQNEFDRRLDHQNQQMQSYYQMKVSNAVLTLKQNLMFSRWVGVDDFNSAVVIP